MFQIQLKFSCICLSFLTLGTLFGTTEQTNSSLSTTSTLDGYLKSTGPTFSRPYGVSNSNYYYQAIRVTVSISGTYSFTSNSSMNTYGCLYEAMFYPSSPYKNLLVCDHNTDDNQAFLIDYNFKNTRIYMLVVTTSLSSVTGKYSIIAAGLGLVSMTEFPVISTTISGSLSSSNPTFARPNGSSSNYYYESIAIRTLNKSGFFIFQSNSSTSTDLYGCLYLGWFDPSDASINKLICDENSGDDHQLQFSEDLLPSPSDAFTLVITTSVPSTTGSYSISVTGPSLISMTLITPYPHKFPVEAIVGISIGSFVLLTVLLSTMGIYIRRRRQQSILSPPQYN